jgi:hypothetical protein
MLVNVHLNEDMLLKMQRISRDLDRSIDDLCQCAVEEAALDYERRQPRPSFSKWSEKRAG